MPRKIKVVDVVENQIAVQTENTITDIPNDVIVPESPNIPEVILDSPVEIPDEVADEILKPDTDDDVKVKETVKTCKYGTCKLCGKNMLEKNLKYAHPKLCKNRPPPEAPPPPPPSFEQVETIVAKAIKEVKTKPVIEDLRNQKAEVRKQRIKSLIMQALNYNFLCLLYK
jgi:hypothetical protein